MVEEKMKEDEEDEEDLFGQEGAEDDTTAAETDQSRLLDSSVKLGDDNVKTEDKSDKDESIGEANGTNGADDAKRSDLIESAAVKVDNLANPSDETKVGLDSTMANTSSNVIGFELDTTPSDILASSPVPRKTSATPAIASKLSHGETPFLPSASQPSSPSAIAPPSPSAGAPPSAAQLGLPSDVVFPASLSVSLLDGRILETLKELPVNHINAALQEYDDAVQEGKFIRNHGAYLFGVLKRYLSVHKSEQGTMGADLTPKVHMRLEKLVKDGFCAQNEINEKVKSKIRMLSENDALRAIDEFSSVDRALIRNFGSYFMGILNRYMRGERTPKNQIQNGKHDSQGRDDDRGRGRDRDFRRGQGGQGYGQKRDYRRERSRDDPYRRDDTYRNSNELSNFAPRQPSHYGQQPPPPHQASHYGQQEAPPPPPPPPPPARQSYGQQPQYQQHPSFVPKSQQSFVPNQHPPQNYVPTQGSSQPPMQQSFYQQAPHIAHPSAIGNPHVPGRHVPAPAIQNTHARPMGIPGFQNPGVGVHQNMQGFPPSHQQPWQNVSSQQQNTQQDILGIAAKAAQALASSQMILNRPQPPGANYHGQQQPFNPGFQQQPAAQQFTASPTRPRGRTIAQMHELPIAVQFAVQNLQTVGHITGPLDEGILGMVKDLPESHALEAINRFVSLDKSTVRNPTAYLAGLLRRELEKINRR